MINGRFGSKTKAVYGRERPNLRVHFLAAYQGVLAKEAQPDTQIDYVDKLGGLQRCNGTTAFWKKAMALDTLQGSAA
jgi:hypothetical protein